MIITIDTETQGLNPNAYVMGTICDEKGQYETFVGAETREAYYARVVSLCEEAKKRGERVYLYAHNLQYDYVTMQAHLDKKNVIYCLSPFIVDRGEWQEDGTLRESTKMIDTIGLWRGSLAELGEAIGEPKSETPSWLKEDAYSPTREELQAAARYMEQDAKVLMTYLLKLKEMLWKEGIKRIPIITSGQISMSYFLKELKALETAMGTTEREWNPRFHKKRQEGRWLYDVEEGRLWATRHPELITQALRGGRTQAFQWGETPSAWSIDINSLYPYIASVMRFPDLRTERLRHHNTLGKPPELEKIGISRCVVITPKRDTTIGCLPVRGTSEDNEEMTYWPVTSDGQRRVLIGSWTHIELAKAQQEGYEILSTQWSLTWDDGINPFKRFMPKLYEARKKSTGFEKLFYKQMMNSLIGKFGQRREKRITELIDSEQLPEYQARGWEAAGDDGTRLIVQKSQGIDYKKYYCPVINALVTAEARTYLLERLLQIPTERLWYCDTDSILGTGPLPISLDNTDEMFKYSDALGAWKIVKENEPLVVYGKKAKIHGEEATLNRVPKRYATAEAMRTGVVTYEDLVLLRGTDAGAIGTRVTRQRDLSEQRSREEQQVQSVPLLLVDESIKDSITETEFTLAKEAIQQQEAR